nr:MAG TPA: hypothetical protein [Caudoviricetes sp.]
MVTTTLYIILSSSFLFCKISFYICHSLCVIVIHLIRL